MKQRILSLEKIIKEKLEGKEKKISKNKFFIIVDRERYMPTFTLSLLSCNIVYKKGLKSILISDLKNEDFITKIYKSFGITNIFSSFNKHLFFGNLILSLKSIIISCLGILKIKFNSFKWFIENFKFKGILLGDLVYDSYVRNYNNYKNPKTDLRFFILLFQAIFRTERINSLFQNKKIDFILIPTFSYVTNGAIATRVAIKKNIKVIEPYPYGSRTITKNVITNGYHYETVRKFHKKILKVKKKLANDFFYLRFKKSKIGVYTGKKDFFFQNKNKYQKILKKNDLKNFGIDLDNYKKIILFACHAFSDAPHSLGNKFIFKDYYEFLIQTLNFIKYNNDKSVLWLVKRHPSSDYYGESGVVENVVDNMNIENIKLFPEFINTKNALNFCDAVVTGRGTIGMEFACHGKLAVTAGEAPYSFMNFNKVFHNKKLYFDFIKEIKNVKKISYSKTLNARKTLYFLENQNRNFLKVSKIIDKEVTKKFFSINPTIRRYDRYVLSDKLFKNFKKFDILNEYYSDSFINFHEI